MPLNTSPERSFRLSVDAVWSLPRGQCRGVEAITMKRSIVRRLKSVALVIILAGCGAKEGSPPQAKRPDTASRPKQTDIEKPSTSPSGAGAPKELPTPRPKESGKVEPKSKSPTSPTGDMKLPRSAAPGTPAPESAPPIGRPTTRQALDGDYEIVKVFYGTDRAPSGMPPDRLRSQRWSAIGAFAGAGGGLAALLVVTFGFVGPGFFRKLKALSIGLILLAGGVGGFWFVRVALFGDPVFYGDQLGALAVGACEVSIPKVHNAGSMEAPNKLKAEVWDPNKHVMLLGTDAMKFDAFLESLGKTVKSIPAGDRQLLVFVHGFNVTFEDAARRTAQMAYDLEFPGVPTFFSWPSKGVLSQAAYEADELNVAKSVAHLKEFLTAVAANAGADRIHLIAHSMGNRALTGALHEIAIDPKWRGRTIFHEVLLTAPDVPISAFEQIYATLRGTTVRATLYASREDAALKYAARWVHGERRIGDCSGFMTIKPGMESIDVSDVETDLFGGHWYYAENRHVLADIKEVLRRKPADACDLRGWLRAVPIPPQAMYWRMEYR